MKYKYSVGIPARNESKNLEACVLSVINQTISPEKIIICVNGSTDITLQIAKKLEQEYPQILVLKSNEGKPWAWNTIVDKNKSNLLMFVDADVIINKKAFEYLFDLLIKNPDIALVGGSVYRLKPKLNLFTLFNDASYEFVEKQRYINGKLYLANIEKLKKISTNYGINLMPSNIIADDQFLEKLSLLGGGFSITKEAYATCLPIITVRDWFSFRIRVSRGRKQLIQEFPLLFRKSDFLSTRLKNYFNRISHSRNIFKLIGSIFFSMLKEFIYIYVMYIESNRSYSPWKEISSTKMSVSRYSN